MTDIFGIKRELNHKNEKIIVFHTKNAFRI
jgi:hypothetical protein